MRATEPGDVVGELGISDKAGWCGVLELVPCACPRKEMVSETCDSIFGAVRLAKCTCQPMIPNVLTLPLQTRGDMGSDDRE